MARLKGGSHVAGALTVEGLLTTGGVQLDVDKTLIFSANANLTQNKVAKSDQFNEIIDSNITDTGTLITLGSSSRVSGYLGVNTAPSETYALSVYGSSQLAGDLTVTYPGAGDSNLYLGLNKGILFHDYSEDAIKLGAYTDALALNIGLQIERSTGYLTLVPFRVTLESEEVVFDITQYATTVFKHSSDQNILLFYGGTDSTDGATFRLAGNNHPGVSGAYLHGGDGSVTVEAPLGGIFLNKDTCVEGALTVNSNGYSIKQYRQTGSTTLGIAGYAETASSLYFFGNIDSANEEIQIRSFQDDLKLVTNAGVQLTAKHTGGVDIASRLTVNNSLSLDESANTELYFKESGVTRGILYFSTGSDTLNLGGYDDSATPVLRVGVIIDRFTGNVKTGYDLEVTGSLTINGTNNLFQRSNVTLMRIYTDSTWNFVFSPANTSGVDVVGAKFYWNSASARWQFQSSAPVYMENDLTVLGDINMGVSGSIRDNNGNIMLTADETAMTTLLRSSDTISTGATIAVYNSTAPANAGKILMYGDIQTTGSGVGSGNVSVAGTLSAAGVMFALGNSLYIQGSGNQHLWYRDASENLKGVFYYDATTNRMALRSYSDTGSHTAEIWLDSNNNLVTVDTNLQVNGALTVGGDLLSPGSGSSSFVAGDGAVATAVSSIAIGGSSDAGSQGAIAIGGGSDAGGIYSISIGYNSEGSGGASTALGYLSIASGDSGTAIGRNSLVTGNNSTAIGRYATVSASSEIRLGTSSESVKLGNGTTVTSDIRDKTDIENNDLGLDFLMKLETKKYLANDRDKYFKRDEEGQILTDDNGLPVYDVESHEKAEKKGKRYRRGLIAQELEQLIDGQEFSAVCHSLVNSPDSMDEYSINYGEFIPVLIKAVQELKKQLDSI